MLGAGTYNCVLGANDETTVWRVGYNPPQRPASLYERGVAMMELFSQHRYVVGPSLLRVFDSFTLPVPPTISGLELCEKVMETYKMYPGGKWYLQRMERLQEVFQVSKAGIFCMVWFLYTTKAEFGFNHYDIKPGNIMMRHEDIAQRVTFECGQHAWSMNMHSIPIVLDLDLGSVAITRPEKRRTVGTLRFSPPEILISPGEPLYQGYDWWCLGLSIFDNLVRISTTRLASLLDSYIRWIKPSLSARQREKPHMDDLLGVFATNSIMLHMLGNGLRPTHAEPAYLFRSRGYDMLEYFVANDPLYQEYRDKLMEALKPHPGLLPLLQRLLAWDPGHRYFWQEPWRLLHMDYFDELRTGPDVLQVDDVYMYGEYPFMDDLHHTSQRYQRLMYAMESSRERPRLIQHRPC